MVQRWSRIGNRRGWSSTQIIRNKIARCDRPWQAAEAHLIVPYCDIPASRLVSNGRFRLAGLALFQTGGFILRTSTEIEGIRGSRMSL